MPLAPWTWAAEGLSLADWRAEPGGLAGTIQKVLASPFGIRYDHVMSNAYVRKYIATAKHYKAQGATGHAAMAYFLAGIYTENEMLVSVVEAGMSENDLTKLQACVEFLAGQMEVAA